MFLYNLTLQPPTGINQCIIGNFSGSKLQEICVSRGAGTTIEILRADQQTGKVTVVLSHHVFGLVRSLAPFRLTGGSKDYIVVGSDSGKITVLEYNPTKNILEKIHQETFGKSAVRRIVPGQYLAADPKGRAVMIAAVEKQKFVYILNRDSLARLTISSPLEAHKSFTLCYALVGVDVGFENPVFAALEVDYQESDQDPTGEAFENAEKVLTYYELDLGLNHVVRKWSEPVPASANHLIAIPGGTDGPSGVLVCSEGFITWYHQGFPAKRVTIPRRPPRRETGVEEDDAGKPRLIAASVVHRMRSSFFILAQTEDGDVFKVQVDYPPGAGGDIQGITAIRLKYFDTVPVATGLVLLKTGFLFVAAEFGNHVLYQIENLGDDDTEQTEYTSLDFPDPEEAEPDEISPVFFRPRALRNLVPVDEADSLAPLTDCKLMNLLPGEDTPQLYVTSGRGARASFRTLRHGIEVQEMAVSELPGNPNAVWTVKVDSRAEFDSYIIVSFTNATLVLSIGETVEEVTDTGFIGTSPTLAVTQLGDDALIQVYPQGIRHIRADRRVNEWKTPGGRHIVKAACNSRQVAIALSSGEIVYFELDAGGHLNEYGERREMPSGVSCLAVGEVEEGRVRSKFLAVGCLDQTIRVLALDPDNCLQPVSMQAVNAIPESLLIAATAENTAATNSSSTLYLHAGLQNGILLRTVLDPVTGQLSDTRMRFLGAKGVRLFAVKVQGQSAVLGLSSRPWLGYTWNDRARMVPLTYEMLEWGSSFSSEQCPEGIVAISANTLRILTVEKLGNTFNQHIVPLRYTPRKFMLHEPSNKFVVIESEHRALALDVLRKEAEEDMETEDGAENNEVEYPLPPEQFGVPKEDAGKWASAVRVIDPMKGETTSLVYLEENEAAFSVSSVTFYNDPTETYVCVGTARDVTLSPRTCSSGFIRMYKLDVDGKLQLMHVTPVDDVPHAMCPFQGRLLVGVGRILRIYDLGKKKLLRKCENKQIPTCIINLHTQGDRIVIGDLQESTFYASYRRQDNRIIVFADDTTNRYTTCTTMVDYDTVVGGDKFGNFWVARLPSDVSQDLDDDPTGNKLVFEKGFLQGAAYKLQRVCEYFVGDTLTSITKTALVPGGREILVYTSMLGSIGIFVPFQSKEDVDFFQNLEFHLRNELPPICGRDHLAYRGSFIPAKGVIDGDLCEQFSLLPWEKRTQIAEELDRTVPEVMKKLEDIRVRGAF
ncbi:hypothetical protein M427DRAFT_450591 [Gonapodya prolifera JEL478]|uniref:DNA damage-binding protein 1 n=1 Tax=Gonapodya prolifera (strain JEL478) TaxID=1344416 RepID=A0A139ARR4_GONPJ|nr:hypothetical protein M427DRAFT_450591 [Gonapodya prolifera JEL478]|eukprot:KXS19436.1 hypothetical protein M427DRAFT_450591 [Gonapodya prolifera JEL478]